MPKNLKKKPQGGKGSSESISKPLNVAESGQDYGIVLATLGDRHFTVACQDGKERRCHVRGKMKNRQFVRTGDVVLVCTRDFDDNSADIIDVYSNDLVRLLRKEGHLKIGKAETGEVTSTDIIPDRVDHDTGFDFDSI